MKMFHAIAVCFFVFVSAVKGDVYREFNIMTPLDHTNQTGLTFIHSILENSGDSMYGWVDLDVLEYRTRNMKVEIKDDKAVCANGPNAVSLKIVGKQVVSEDEEFTKYMVTVEYLNHHHSVELPNPLPIIVSKYSKVEEFIINMDLEPGFEGYLVCTAANAKVFLVPKQGPIIDFINPPWKIKVKIDIYRNPLATYGRMFRIINLDNVSVLQDGRREFFFTLKRSQLYLVYYLYLAMKDQDKGKYCTLSKSSENELPLLECESFKVSTKAKAINKFFMWSFLGSAIFNVTNSIFFRKPESDNPNLLEGSSSVSSNSSTSGQALTLPDSDHNDRIITDKELNKSKRTVLAATTLPLLLGLISYNIYDGISRIKVIVNNVKLLRQQYINAPFAYNWSLANVQEK